MTTEKADQAIARADRVMRQLDERDGSVRAAARRERQRLNAGLGRTFGRVGMAILAISIVTTRYVPLEHALTERGFRWAEIISEDDDAGLAYFVRR